MSEHLTALGLQFYRGIGEHTQFVGPFSRFNFYAGANNAGKSILLNFISEHLPQGSASSNWSSISNNSPHRFRGPKSGKTSVFGAINFDAAYSNATNLLKRNDAAVHHYQAAKRILEALSEGDLIWYQLDFQGSASRLLKEDDQTWNAVLHSDHWRDLWSVLTKQNGGGFKEHWLPETLQIFRNICSPAGYSSRLIPAIRQIGPKGVKMDDLSGTGLIDRLAEIQSPDHDLRHERKVFDRINEFLQFVTGKGDAEIEIPHNRQHVLVHIDSKVLPLSSLGTGIHEVVMIAAFCTLHDGEIICIEEPEIHLHPVLQRKLVYFLRENTSSQYFIATHSASFIDTPNSSVFHVRNDGIQTYINSARLRSERRSMTDELGYKASDIIQSNAVIWVEGPSDQIYLRHWIKSFASDLIEGIDYSIMFYGGRLLSHLTANPDELDQFINLRSLNQNSAIIMDSDKSAARSKINSTKMRVRDEFADSGFSWITKGREIENYIEHSALQNAVKSVHSKVYDQPLAGGPFDHALYFQRKKPRGKNSSIISDPKALVETSIDKVAVARRIAEQPANLNVLDLNERITELVEFLKAANL